MPFALKFTHIFGPVLVIVAFWMLGRGMVNRTRGRNFRVLPAFLMLVAALAYRFMVSKETLAEAYGFVRPAGNTMDFFLDRLTLALMDFGIGMIIDAGYLSYKKHNARLFWVPGVLALIISSFIFLFATLIERVGDGLRRPRPDDAQLLLELGPDDDISELDCVLRRYSATYTRAFENIDAKTDYHLSGQDERNLSQYYLIYVDPHYAPVLRDALAHDHENVDQIAPNGSVSLIEPLSATGSATTAAGAFVANDPQLQAQWFAEGLDYNGAHQLLKNNKPRRKAKVAIVDTGVEGGHEDLSPVYGGGKSREDKHGHGTHCAGLASAATNNRIGIGSLNWDSRYLELRGYPALNERGFGTDRSVAQAVIDAANDGADVISMSLGGYGKTSKAQADAIRYALRKQAIVVVAAGNDNSDARDYSPASMPGVIVVSAVDPNWNKASFSNTNMSLDMPIAAPGVDILSSIPGSRYQRFNGTSMATPIVAGLVGVLRAFDPSLSPQQAHELLKRSGREVNDSYRVGRVIQPAAAIGAVVGQQP